MPQPEKCPFCGGRPLFPAEFRKLEDAGRALLTFHDIKPFPWWKFASAGNEDAWRDVDVDRPTACLSCGMVWAKYDVARARQLAELHGSSDMKAALRAPDD